MSGAGSSNGEATRQTGLVKFFNDQHGYGFIRPDNNGRDIFVHITAVQAAGRKTLKEGERLAYETRDGGPKADKGPKAINLEFLEG